MKKKTPSWLSRLAAGLGMACIVLALIAWGLVEYSRSELLAYRAELEKRGEEFSILKLAPPPPKPDEEAGELLAAMRVLEVETKTKKFPIIWGGRKDSGKPGAAIAVHRQPSFQQGNKEISWPDIQRELAPLEKLFAEIREAAALPNRAFTFNYALGPNSSPGFITPCLKSCQWLGRENLRLLHEGRVEESVANIEAMLSIARKIHGQATLMSQLVGNSVLGIASISSWEVLAASPDEKSLRRLAAAWQDMKNTSPLPATLRVERSWGLNAFRSDFGTLWNSTKAMAALTSSFSSAPPPSRLEDWVDSGLLFVTYATWSTFFRYADERQFLEYYQMLLESREQNEDWKTLLAKSSAVETRLSAGSVGNFCSRTTISGLKYNLERLALVDTTEKLTVTAIALRRFQLAHGNALPDSLEELVPQFLPAVPLDPMDHRPIRYRATAEGYLLYGIGQNGKDEGGNPNPVPGKRAISWDNGLDIVWPQVTQ